MNLVYVFKVVEIKGDTATGSNGWNISFSLQSNTPRPSVGDYCVVWTYGDFTFIDSEQFLYRFKERAPGRFEVLNPTEHERWLLSRPQSPETSVKRMITLKSRT